MFHWNWSTVAQLFVRCTVPVLYRYAFDTLHMFQQVEWGWTEIVQYIGTVHLTVLLLTHDHTYIRLVSSTGVFLLWSNSFFSFGIAFCLNHFPGILIIEVGTATKSSVTVPHISSWWPNTEASLITWVWADEASPFGWPVCLQRKSRLKCN